MNSVTQDILNFIDIEDYKNISLFINIVRNYYYNNDLPSTKEQALFKEWFKLKNIKEIETFLSNISDELYDKIIENTGMNGKILDNVNDIGATPHNKKCNLPVFMGSLNKIKTEEDFMNWMKKNNSSEMIITEKLDGISALLSITEYEVKLYTRGNGKIGCDISHLVQYLDLNKCIEKTRKYYNEFPLYIRGELIMEKINKSNETENIRNIVSGIVHTKDITKEIINKLKDVHFVAYRLYNETSYRTQYNILKNFNYILPQMTSLKTPDFDELIVVLISFTNKSNYQIDGIVISTNIQPNVDPVDKNPEHSIAIKNISQSKQTKVLEIEWNVSKHGVYKPRIKIEPININGANIEWVTGFNAKYIKDNNIGKDTILEVERSGDVIPNIKRIIKCTNAELPKDNWKWNKTGVDICIIDENNDEMEIKKLLIFFQELECPNLGPKTIETLYEYRYKTVLDVLNLTKQKLLETDKFKDKSAENVLKGIKIAKEYLSVMNKDKLHILMYASGTFGFGFGSKKIKLILDKYPNIVEKYKDIDRDIWINNVKNVKGISEQAECFVDSIYKYKMFIKTIDEYINYTDVNDTKDNKENKENKENKNNKIKGVIVMTGFRDKILKQKLEENNYVVNDNVTKETTILIYKEDDSSSKCKKAKLMGIQLISKHDVLNKLNIK